MNPSELRKLGDLFSDYRAEWSAALFGDLFIAPPYFSKLEIRRPCFLIGGRGTGKTTALRSLRFDASAARLTSDSLPSGVLPYFGIYIRINKNRVRAFQGTELSNADWQKAFAHYFNILSAIELCRLTQWLEGADPLARLDLRGVAATFDAPDVHDSAGLLSYLTECLVALELYVNNPTLARRPVFSVPESPLRHFVESLVSLPLARGKVVFCCIDEYENLLDYQQAIINTYIKHSEPPLSYKVGVKRGGLRSRATSDTNDVLATPDDFSEIDIGQESFDTFARQVVEHRLLRAQERGLRVADSIDDFLPEMPFSVEAEKLGCFRVAEEVLEELIAANDLSLVKWARDVPKNELYFIKYWAEGDKGSIAELARHWKAHPDQWATRLGNYGYASLFWLSKGRKGARIRKYYSGSRTFLGLASGNIRYFIALIEESIAQLSSDQEAAADYAGHLPPEHQTLAARAVGKQRLDQLEGLSEHGSEIKRLVLALGKVFFEFARDPVGKSPERNSFVVTGEGEPRKRVLGLLHEGVSNLAFEVTPRTKATTQREMRDDEFRIHPIYAPFFEYSHRRKRRCTFAAETLLEVFSNPARALAMLMSRQPTATQELPNQLAMFSSFYDSGDAEPSST
jgi:hypothetical protein